MIMWTNKHKIIQETFIAVHASCIQKEKKNHCTRIWLVHSVTQSDSHSSDKSKKDYQLNLQYYCKKKLYGALKIKSCTNIKSSDFELSNKLLS